MLVFHSQKLVYLAVPKTGTTAVENALGASASSVFRDPPGLKHANARRFEREFRPILEKSGQRTFKTVAAIREPLDWLASWYRYRTRPAIAGHPNSTRDISFDAFIEAYLSEDQPPFAKVGSQARFLTDTDGKVLVDHVFPYERLKEMIAFLEARLRIETTIETVNASPSLEIALESG
ncbi:MAG: sulfotransferase family 2 domain-containing protein, partial [Litoreibacter sp.]|nr:sulfotransferase family 2 domain-containing protein [Litoreibacter sp.]